jgi:NET1-associated nuclear protein 1 (U3 small nucleolar RNA-associated protein 17)
LCERRKLPVAISFLFLTVATYEVGPDWKISSITMAGSKGPRAKDDKTKKRKRDTLEGETKPKRHRQRSRGSNVNGNSADAPAKEKEEEPRNELLIGELSSFRPQEVIRQSDDGEAGWRISKPMGGRMLDIDPILTADEQ